MKIILDAFGGDNAPLEILKGAEMAVKEFNIDIILTGNEEVIKKVASENNVSLERMEIVHCTQQITMEDNATDVLKAKADSSMSVGLRLLAENKGDAFVSAGNSGAIVMGATMLVKRIKGIKRPGFAPIIPTSSGCAMLIDGGANVDCRADMLQQFGIMGSLYMQNVMNVSSPKVGLANVGTEEHKGTELQHEAYKLLKDSPLNFTGNIEGRDIPLGTCDVIVADGFTGNMILKTYEGVAMALMSKLKGIFTKNLKTKLAAGLVLSDMKEMKKEFDYNEYGGAPILGVTKPVFKAHGSAKAKTLKNAIGLTVNFVNGGVTEKITDTVAKLYS